MVDCFPRSCSWVLFDDGSPGDFEGIDQQDVLGMNGKIGVGTDGRPSIKLGRNIHLSVDVVHILIPNKEMETKRVIFVSFPDRVKMEAFDYITTESKVPIPGRWIVLSVHAILGFL